MAQKYLKICTAVILRKQLASEDVVFISITFPSRHVKRPGGSSQPEAGRNLATTSPKLYPVGSGFTRF